MFISCQEEIYQPYRETAPPLPAGPASHRNRGTGATPAGGVVAGCGQCGGEGRGWQGGRPASRACIQVVGVNREEGGGEEGGGEEGTSCRPWIRFYLMGSVAELHYCHITIMVAQPWTLMTLGHHLVDHGPTGRRSIHMHW